MDGVQVNFKLLRGPQRLFANRAFDPLVCHMSFEIMLRVLSLVLEPLATFGALQRSPHCDGGAAGAHVALEGFFAAECCRAGFAKVRLLFGVLAEVA